MVEGREFWNPWATSQSSKIEDIPWAFGQGVSGFGKGVLCQPQVQQWHSQNKCQRCGDGNQ